MELLCPECGKGELVDRIIRENIPDIGESIEDLFFSCNHEIRYLHCKDEIPLVIEETRTKIKIFESGSNKPKFETDKKLCDTDIDNPQKRIFNIYYHHRDGTKTNVFHIVEYEDGQLKHLHCKKCNNEWNYLNQDPLEEYFRFENNDKLMIECKKCQCKFER